MRRCSKCIPTCCPSCYCYTRRRLRRVPGCCVRGCSILLSASTSSPSRRISCCCCVRRGVTCLPRGCVRGGCATTSIKIGCPIGRIFSYGYTTS
jgi:hypothetical protein